MSSLKELLAKARGSVTYLAERVILDFTSDLDRLMSEKELSRAEVGRRIGASPAYVTKVMRGNTNLTVKSMVALAAAVGASVQIVLISEEDQRNADAWWTVGAIESRRAQLFLPLAVVAANEESWQTLKIAA